MERPPLEPEIRQFIGTLAACDWLDTTLAHIPMGKRADYYFRIPNIIVEQKGIHVDRRSYLANAMQRAYVLVRKNGMDDQQFWDFAARSGGRLARAVTGCDEDLGGPFRAACGVDGGHAKPHLIGGVPQYSHVRTLPISPW